jgi:hypothetical protein
MVQRPLVSGSQLWLNVGEGSGGRLNASAGQVGIFVSLLNTELGWQALFFFAGPSTAM